MPWLECTRRGAPQGGLGKIRNRNRPMSYVNSFLTPRRAAGQHMTHDHIPIIPSYTDKHMATCTRLKSCTHDTRHALAQHAEKSERFNEDSSAVREVSQSVSGTNGQARGTRTARHADLSCSSLCNLTEALLGFEFHLSTLVPGHTRDVTTQHTRTTRCTDYGRIWTVLYLLQYMYLLRGPPELR